DVTGDNGQVITGGSSKIAANGNIAAMLGHLAALPMVTPILTHRGAVLFNGTNDQILSCAEFGVATGLQHADQIDQIAASLHVGIIGGFDMRSAVQDSAGLLPVITAQQAFGDIKQ